MVLTNIAMDGARVWMASILALMGVIIVLRFGFGKNLIPSFNARTRHLWPVGPSAVLSTPPAARLGPCRDSFSDDAYETRPHRVVGTVNTAEFIVAVAASMGFPVGAASPASRGWP